MHQTYKGYKFFYTNGSSHTKGGGLEEPSIREGWPCREEYEKKYGVTWNSRDEINWATRLSKRLGIKVYNEAECGGGTYRAIRMAYNFIDKHSNEIGDFFIVLELPCLTRLDVFYKPQNRYYIVNTNKHDQLLWATPHYYPRRIEDDGEQVDFKDYVSKYVDWENLNNTFHHMIVGFYSYCKRRGIPIKLLSTIGIEGFRKVFDQNDLVSPGDSTRDIFHWCVDNKCLIWDEVDNVEDGHPGYFGHIKYAEFLHNWLDINLENKKGTDHL